MVSSVNNSGRQEKTVVKSGLARLQCETLKTFNKASRTPLPPPAPVCTVLPEHLRPLLVRPEPRHTGVIMEAELLLEIGLVLPVF